MKDNREIMCDECKRMVISSDIRYSQKGNSVIKMCSDCRDRTVPRKLKQSMQDKAEIKKEIRPEVKIEVKPILKTKSSALGKGEYFCSRCRYKFRYDPSKGNNLKCPYCSSAGYVTSLKDLSSSKLLKEVNDFD